MVSKLTRFLFKQAPLLVAMVVTSLGASVFEALSLGLVVPLFEVLKTGGETATYPFPLNHISGFFARFDPASTIGYVAGFLVLTNLLKGLSTYYSNVTSYMLNIKVIKHYRMLCYEQLMRANINYINTGRKSHFQAILVHMTNEVGTIVKIVGMLVPKLFTIIVLMVMLFMLSWKMTLAAIGLATLATLFMTGVMKKSHILGRKFANALKDLNNVVLEALMGLKVVHLFSREKDHIDDFSKEVDSFNFHLLNLVKLRGSISPIIEFVGIVCLAALLVIGSLIFSGKSGNGLEIILLFGLIFFRILPPAISFNQARADIKSIMPCFKDIHEFLEETQSSVIPNGTKDITSLKTGIEFSNIHFKYHSKQDLVLRGISFQLEKGKKIGVVGASGSGKSTISELILRFYDPEQGQILVDGIDLKEYDVHAWRRLIGVVSQDIFLFNDTIKGNISFSEPGASDADIEKAARLAHAHEFIKDLPYGYDTRIGDRGVLLSGGQRQRLAIARAVLHKPQILIFDEATSALDTESERIVQTALDEVSAGKTVVAIAHRLSTVANADQILVVEQGKIVETGTHQELMKKSGNYQRLVSLQMLEK